MHISLQNKRTYLLFHLALALFMLLTFRVGMDNFFAGDDFDWLFMILKTRAHPLYFFTSQAYFVRHTEMFYFLVNFWLAGFNPVSYYVTAILIHVVTVILVSFSLNRICQNRFAGLIGALFWGVNYKHVEAVFRLYGVADSLALLFCLAAFLLFLRGQLRLATLAFIVGLFGKENAMVFPLVLSVYIMLFHFSEWKPQLRRTIPFWLASAGYAGLGWYVRRGSPSYLTIDKNALIRFCELMLSYVGPDVILLKQVWLGEKDFLFPVWVAIILFVILAILVWKLPNIYRFGILWMGITTIPTVFVTFQTSRYHYVPLVGLGIIVGQGFYDILTFLQKKHLQKAIVGMAAVFTLILVYNVIGVNLEERDYAFYGEIHRQAAESFQQNILPYMATDPYRMTVFPNTQTGKWIGIAFERNRSNPWYFPTTYKWVFVRPHGVLGLTSTYSFVSYCAFQQVKDALFVMASYEEFRQNLASGEFSIIVYDEQSNTFTFGSDTLKPGIMKHRDEERMYHVFQPGYFDPTFTGEAYP